MDRKNLKAWRAIVHALPELFNLKEKLQSIAAEWMRSSDIDASAAEFFYLIKQWDEKKLGNLLVELRDAKGPGILEARAELSHLDGLIAISRVHAATSELITGKRESERIMRENLMKIIGSIDRISESYERHAHG